MSDRWWLFQAIDFYYLTREQHVFLIVWSRSDIGHLNPSSSCKNHRVVHHREEFCAYASNLTCIWVNTYSKEFYNHGNSLITSRTEASCRWTVGLALWTINRLVSGDPFPAPSPSPFRAPACCIQFHHSSRLCSASLLSFCDRPSWMYACLHFWVLTLSQYRRRNTDVPMHMSREAWHI